MAHERLEAEIEVQRDLAEERMLKSEEKVHKWMQKKQSEAERKMIRLLGMKRVAVASLQKPVELKKSGNFQEWLAKKKQEPSAMKMEQKASNSLSLNKGFKNSVAWEFIEDWD